MAFQVSPGVLVQEKDLSRIIPAVSTSIGAFAGQFAKGPVDEIVAISSEQELVDTFGKPNSSNFEYFFSAANFLAYSNALRVVRATNSSLTNANTGGSSLLIKNDDDYDNNYASGQANAITFTAKSAGAWGNNLLVATCPSANAYEQTLTTSQQVDQADLAVGDLTVDVDSDATTYLNVGDIIEFSTTGAATDFDDGDQYRVTSVASTSIGIVQHPRGAGGLKRVVADDARIKRRWRYYDSVDGAPGTSTWTSTRSGSGDEIHVVVIDEDGGISGTPGEVIETFSKLSEDSDAKTPQGDSNYYPDVIYNKSNYIYWMDHNSSGTNWGTAAAGLTFTDVATPTLESMSAGADGSTASTAQLKTAYEKFADSETVDVGLTIAGKGDATHIDNLITVAEDRKDAIVFCSPERADVVNV